MEPSGAGRTEQVAVGEEPQADVLQGEQLEDVQGGRFEVRGEEITFQVWFGRQERILQVEQSLRLQDSCRQAACGQAEQREDQESQLSKSSGALRSTCLDHRAGPIFRRRATESPMAHPEMSNSPDVKPSPLPASEPTHSASDRELPVSSPSDDAGAPAAPRSAADQNDPSRASGAAVDAHSASPPADGELTEELTEDQVKIALRRVKDPELNLNILDLGLVYEIRVTGNDVAIDMSLTSPGCPSGPEIMSDAERHLRAIPGVGDVAVNLVWSPFWSPDRIEPRVRAYLGF